MPSKLYRFRPIHGEIEVEGVKTSRFEVELDSILNSFIYASELQKLNDPTEVYIDKGFTDEEHVESLVKGYGRSRGKAQCYVNKFQENESVQETERIYLDVLSKFSAVSFTESNCNLPLWAYYAGDFSGICIEYDNRLLHKSFLDNKVRKVSYTDKPDFQSVRQEISEYLINNDRMDELENSMLKRVSNKHCSWSHEQEWRWIFGSEGKQYYIDNSLVRIFLGPRVHKFHRDKILNSLKNRHVEIVSMKLHDFFPYYTVIQEACPLEKCSRTGRGYFEEGNIDVSRITDFIRLPIFVLYDACTELMKDPNAEGITRITLHNENGGRICLWVKYVLRNNSHIEVPYLYDTGMRLIE